MPVYKAIPAITESTLVDGDTFYWQTDEFKRLAAGSNGDKLVLVGGLPVWETLIAARVYRNATQSIANSSQTAVQFDTEVFDTDAMWVIGTPDRITVQTAGKYLVIAGVQFATNNTNNRILTLKEYNSSSVAIDSSSFRVLAAQDEDQLSACAIFTGAVGDYFRCEVTHNISGGGALNTSASPQTFLSVARLGI